MTVNDNLVSWCADEGFTMKRLISSSGGAGNFLGDFGVSRFFVLGGDVLDEMFI